MRVDVIYLTENEVVTMNEKSHLPAPPAGAPTPENVNPAPDRISPEKCRNIALFAICLKTQIKLANQKPAGSNGSNQRKLTRGAEPPPIIPTDQAPEAAAAADSLPRSSTAQRAENAPKIETVHIVYIQYIQLSCYLALYCTSPRRATPNRSRRSS